MNNYIIPTTVVDNFFDNPLMVRDYALRQEYQTDDESRWPGERSLPLHKLDKNFFDNTITRFLKIFYPANHTYAWSSTGCFQKVSSIYDSGWAHVDDALITGIIYLDDDATPDAGTTVYDSAVMAPQALHQDKFAETIKDPKKNIEYKNYREENNKQFSESIIVKNKFNRLVAFDSHMYHAANNFVKNNTSDRLTLVFFIYKLQVDQFPLQRFKREN